MMVVEGVEEGTHMGFGVVGISYCNCVNVQKKQHMVESKVSLSSENGRNAYFPGERVGRSWQKKSLQKCRTNHTNGLGSLNFHIKE